MGLLRICVPEKRRCPRSAGNSFMQQNSDFLTRAPDNGSKFARRLPQTCATIWNVLRRRRGKPWLPSRTTFERRCLQNQPRGLKLTVRSQAPYTFKS